MTTIKINTGATGNSLVLSQKSGAGWPYGNLDVITIPWDDIPKLVADLLEQKRQHDARELHGKAIQARRAANTPWDKPRYCAPSLRLYNERRQLKHGEIKL